MKLSRPVRSSLESERLYLKAFPMQPRADLYTLGSMATTKGSSSLTIRLRYVLSIPLLAVFSCWLGCNTSNPSPASSSSTLRLSMIPNTDPGKILRENQPLITYLEQATGAHVELSVPTNYAAVVEALANEQVDI